MKLKLLHQKDHFNMIDYNLALYFGIGLIVFGLVLFFISIHFERRAEIKLFKLEQLNKSFERNKHEL